ncbi:MULTISPECIES: endonuclease/exonuclease/phosphatase family protein [Okeania]|uniref:Endonuclease/exonuclease/phosphatase family protein n=2 Tax=Okeania TaxID=1458928 RepID=A0A3N6PG09_9CYAN|nr:MULTISPECIES: endonuclease/exonuclease/phosphatase family protein [Okeania]NET77282.1 endonuclease/exonuclease/phosphatase family protein [Okeania sp. SIO1F9]RQH18956.1 endonuclease/exonuclease/phosphatase family protein [Okeania hirsuta]RQH47229.1 endonuclease/exonuclease/phosphatase family protein [Okeania hirsuta]
METSSFYRLKQIFSYLLTTGIIITTLFSLGGYWQKGIIFELISHFKVQYFVISLILLCCLGITGKKRLLLVGIFCTIINLTPILPWYIHKNGISQETPNLRILVYNLYGGRNSQYSQVTKMVRQENPDIAIFLEPTNKWFKNLQRLSDILPNSINSVSQSTYGTPPYGLVAVYSKFPLNNYSIEFFAPNKPTIITNFNINQQTIYLIATHPTVPIYRSTFKQRNQILKKLSKYIQQLNHPVILAGDLNITMWSPDYHKLEQETGLRNSRLGFGIIPTWPARFNNSVLLYILSRFFQIPIDHCLISSEIKVVNVNTRANSGLNLGSDHLPLITDLFISKSGN